jgi:NhaA family Na+:H+ antiporter
MTTAKSTILFEPIGSQDHMLGNEGAAVIFVEYGDFQCPHCQQAQSIIKDLRDELGDRFLYVFRHFPLSSSHPDALRAAEASEAAAVQGKYWEYHEALFDHQEDLDQEHLLEHAAEIGLDLERFTRELEEGIHTERVAKDLQSGVKSGVSGTPTFFINGQRYDGPWDLASLKAEIEKPLGVQIRNVFQRFTQLQAAGGILLLFTTILALVLANSQFAEGYFRFWETELSINLGAFTVSEDLLHWVNDGLMVIFFFVVGLEIKREITVGELASTRRAIMPIVAAVGGVVLPATIFLSLNYGGPYEDGWAIPVATDIAFTLAILTLFGNRIPIALKVFFTAFAIVDDLAAVIILAIFYSKGIVVLSLVIGLIILVFLILLNRLGVRSPLPYAILGIGLWFAFLESGVHPTIAGVLLAFTIPSRAHTDTEAYRAQCNAVLGYAGTTTPTGQVLTFEEYQQAAARTLERIAERMQSPAQRLETSVTPWATFLVLPIFALANAGIVLGGNVIEALISPIGLGIMLGLVIGKPLGLTLFSWLAVRLRLAEMPKRTTWPQLFSATWLGGIGFTMSLFIASSAFADPEVLNTAKISVLAASILAGTIGSILIAITTTERRQVSELTPADATG